MAPKRKARFYGVQVGEQPGVYDDWETCKLQVLGFSGSKYKGFSTRAEAEDYVREGLGDDQTLVEPKIKIFRPQENTHPGEVPKYIPVPVATSKKHTIQPPYGQTGRTPKNVISSPLPSSTRIATNVVIPKEDATSPFDLSTRDAQVSSPGQLSPKDPSNHFKLIEENGQRFVVFESIKKFDSYFEGLCRKRQPGKSWNSKTFCGNQESSGQMHSSAMSSKDIHTKESDNTTMEDDDFVYFKDEDELMKFLEPYFQSANQNPPSRPQVFRSAADGRGPSFARAFRYFNMEGDDKEYPSEPLQSRVNFDAGQGFLPIDCEGIYQIEFDGASKGNPGRAGAGALIRCPHGSVVFEMTEFLGTGTNNVAEYRALILGLKVASSKGMRRVRAQGDSKLVCLQVTGVWAVENKNILPLYEEVKRLEKLFDSFSIAHIRREYNSAADALANEAVYGGEPAREIPKAVPDCCLPSAVE